MRALFLLSLTAALSLTALSAGAEVRAVWEDTKTHASFSVPDTWRMIQNQKPDDLATFAAPGNHEYAQCRLRSREDRRFLVYPVQFSANVQRTALSDDFWEGYLAEYGPYTINALEDNAGLGRGFGSYVDASYETVYGPKMQRRGLIYASTYNGKTYVLECSTEASSFEKWRPAFLGVVSSVDFRKEINEFRAGYYRPFLKDRPLGIHGGIPGGWVYY
ncbi:MAG: hypothetical protein K9G62_04140 [Alphaproteobacteria bacterium]|nr:hypothetical protein [Alphaproteobacteria bacterium]